LTKPDDRGTYNNPGRLLEFDEASGMRIDGISESWLFVGTQAWIDGIADIGVEGVKGVWTDGSAGRFDGMPFDDAVACSS
jgi:hypothetical protein